jgi:hypothetical protein
MTAVVEGSAVVVSRSVVQALEAGVQPGSVMCASLSVGPVAGWLPRGGGCAAAGLVSEVKVAGDPVPTEGELPAWGRALAGAVWVARRARPDAEAARPALTAHQVGLEQIVDAAYEYADDNDLCLRFDEFMIDQGGGRDRAGTCAWMRRSVSPSGVGASLGHRGWQVHRRDGRRCDRVAAQPAAGGRGAGA